MKIKPIILLFAAGLLMFAGCTQTNTISQGEVFVQDIKYTKQSFVNEKLNEGKANEAKKPVYQNTIDDILQTFYQDGSNITSYIKIGDTEYILGQTLYDNQVFSNIPLKLTKTDLHSKYPIYKFEEVIGAASAKTIYLAIENQVPKIIMSMDGDTLEKDIDNDKVLETIAQYGTPGMQTTIYKWDFDNQSVSYINLNETVFKGSPSVYINDKSQVAAYIDGKEKYYVIKNDKLYEAK